MNSENPYKQSWLSAYFGILPRSRKDDKGHQARKAWLDTHFGRLDIAVSGSRFVAALPVAYCSDVHPMPLTDRLIGRRLKITLHRLEATSDSLTESVGLLQSKVIEFALEHKTIDIYRAKPGQQQEVLTADTEYLCVQRYDPLHNHDSTDLIDFNCVRVSPVIQQVERYSFEGMHKHLINPKLVT